MLRTEEFTKQFYDWEERLRGYLLWPYPVPPEPPFVPFHRRISLQKITDDSRKPTLLSLLTDKVIGFFQPPPQNEEDEEYDFENDGVPDLFIPTGDIVELQVALPKDFSCSKTLMAQLLSALTYIRFPISFEIIGTSSRITVQLAVRESDKSHIVTQLKAFIPDGVIHETQSFLPSLWEDEDNKLVVDFGLEQEGLIPLLTHQRFEIDSLVSIIGALSTVREGIGLIQIIFQPARFPWANSLVSSVTTSSGKPFFVDAPELNKHVQQKINNSLYGVVLRVGVTNHNTHLLKQLGSALCQCNSPALNALIPLNNDNYPLEIHAQDVVDRLTHRSGMLLNADELINFVHFPSADIKEKKLFRISGKTKSSPDISLYHSLLLGHNLHHGESRPVTLNQEQRMRHLYMVGASGTGKSTLLTNLIIQDIQSGNGVAVFDPHGDLIDKIIQFIPKSRLSDVILFDPTDEEYPIGFNIFSAHSEVEKTLLSSDLVGVFKRLSSSWGDQMHAVFANGILAMLESNQPTTLLTLRRFLVEKEFRTKFLQTVTDPEIVYYWEKEFPLLTGRPHAPVLTRLDTFLRPKPIRFMIAQEKNRIDFSEIMDSGKIFLAKLSHGGIGEENAYLLGALLVAKIHQMALARQKQEASARKPFYIYLDEFQNFITPSMEGILSGARKYNLGLILAHQELRQLLSKDREVASSVLSNPYTRICFRIGETDADALSKGFSFFGREELQSLSIGEAIGRIEQAQYDFNLVTEPPPEIPEDCCAVADVIAYSRKTYASSKSEIEKLLFPPPHKKEGGGAKEKLEPVEIKKDEREHDPPSSKKVPSIIPKEEATAQPTHGRGSVQHKYLQQLIKRIAQEKQYRAELELPILGNTGFVDVSLSNQKEQIACEISVTTPPEHELGNIQKCLAHGYDVVIILSHEKRQLEKIAELAAKSLDQMSLEKCHFLQPEEFIDFLDARQVVTKEKIVRGYKVNVAYSPVDKKEERAKKESIAKLIVDSMKRMTKQSK